MPITRTESLPLRSEQDIVLARQTVRRLTQELGFGLVDQTKLVTATSELARNALDATKRSQIMFMDRDDILNLYVVTNLALPPAALPAPTTDPWALPSDDPPF